ncbi:hypothetical protein ACJX0J_011082 [Zea mays]
MTYPVCENMYIIQWTWKQSNDAQVHPELNDDLKEVALWTWKIVTFNCTGKNDNGCLHIQRERINFQQGKLQIVVLFDMWKQNCDAHLKLLITFKAELHLKEFLNIVSDAKRRTGKSIFEGDMGFAKI